MNKRLSVGLALAFIACGATAAVAEDRIDSDGNLIRRTKLERSCSDALARFCPDLAETPGQTRNQVICLKPYRTSLTPYCRAAVNAALK